MADEIVRDQEHYKNHPDSLIENKYYRPASQDVVIFLPVLW